MDNKQLYNHTISFSNEEEALPSVIHLLPPSGFTGRDGRGPFVYNFDELNKVFVEENQHLPIDRDHASLHDESNPNFDGQAYGWINSIFQNELGVFANVEWTTLGQELLRNKIYRYLSPAYYAQSEQVEDEGMEATPLRISSLLNTSLVNRPNLRLLSLHSQEGVKYSIEDADPAEEVTPVEPSFAPEANAANTEEVVTAGQTDIGAVETNTVVDEVKEPVAATEDPVLEIPATSTTEAPADLLAELNALKEGLKEAVETINVLKDALAVSKQAQADAEAKELADKAAKEEADKAAKVAYENACQQAVNEAVSTFKILAHAREEALALARNDLASFIKVTEAKAPVLNNQTPSFAVATQENDSDIPESYVQMAKRLNISVEKMKESYLKLNSN